MKTFILILIVFLAQKYTKQLLTVFVDTRSTTYMAVAVEKEKIQQKSERSENTNGFL